MTESQRNEMIAELTLYSAWNKEALEKLSDRRLIVVFDRYLRGRG